MPQKLDKKSQIYLGIVVIVFLIAVGLIYYFLKTGPALVEEIPQPEKEKVLTPEEIQEALNKKVEPSSKNQPPTPEEIQKALNKKIESSSENQPLTSEEIQQILNKKAE